VIAHDVDHLGKAGADLFKKGLADSAYGGVVVDIHSLTDVTGQD
jgi:hypothetical protein